MARGTLRFITISLVIANFFISTVNGFTSHVIGFIQTVNNDGQKQARS